MAARRLPEGWLKRKPAKKKAKKRTRKKPEVVVVEELPQAYFEEKATADPYLAPRPRGKGRPRKHTFETLHDERKHLYDPKKNPQGWLVGNHQLPACNRISALLFGFNHAETAEAKEYFFWEIANHWWNKDPDDPKFIKNKWSWRVIRAACREKWLAVGGSASSGKSYVFAGWAIINWMADPANTMVLVTSTDLKGARKRIYGAIRRLLAMVPSPPCREKDAMGMISFDNGTKVDDTRGIHIITADKSKSANAVGKMIGYKAPKVILIADEHGEMGQNVTEAAKGNLSKNDSFQMISLSNPASRFDAFGLFAEPAKGWESVNVFDDDEWRTKMKGLYIRLNSEDSPNIDMTPHPEYEVGVVVPGVVNQQQVDDDLYQPGVPPEEVRKTRKFMRFNSAVFFDGDDTETVYSETELVRAGATTQTKINKPTLTAGVDPSYSDNGDNTCMVIAEEGFDQYGQHSIQVKEVIYINEDVTNKIMSRTEQIAEKIMNLCKKKGIAPENLGIDATSGSGTGICDMLRLKWDTNAFLRVSFGGKASKRRIAPTSKILGCERYSNRATELLFQGKQYLMGRQIYGIPPIIAKQMCQRICLDPKKGEKGLVYTVEPKREYKARVGSSPDEMDAFLVCVETAIVRRMFTPADPVPQRENLNIQQWLGQRRTIHSYAADRMGFCGNL